MMNEREEEKRKMKAITFGELREYLCVFDKISICIQETGQYDNYRFIAHVPNDYDRYYLYGFGLFESEFIDEDFEGWDRTGSAFPSSVAYKSGRWSLQPCIEIMLSETPRTKLDEIQKSTQKNRPLVFGEFA